jgi:hypothetical protein
MLVTPVAAMRDLIDMKAKRHPLLFRARGERRVRDCEH